MQTTVEAQRAVKVAREKWEGAPFHVKTMAGAYMEPVLAALDALLRVQVQVQEAKPVQVQAGIALESGEFIPASELNRGQ